MKTIYLFPHKYKKISGIAFVLSIVFLALLFIFPELHDNCPKVPVFAIAGDCDLVSGQESRLFDVHYFSWQYNVIVDEICITLLIISGLVFGFSKEKVEDEMVMSLRLNSLAYATYFNYAVVLFLYLFFYGLTFMKLWIFTLFSTLLFFNIRFQWVLHKYYKN